MALGNANIGSTQTALTDPSSLTSGSLGQQDLGNLLQSDNQVWNSGQSQINTGALNTAINQDYSTATGSVDSSAGAGTSIGSDLGSIISSLTGSNLGTLAGYGAVYGLLADQASSTEQQNNSLANQISAIGQPLVTEGQGLTSAFGQGKLTAPFQSQVTAAETANQNTATSQGQQVARLLANSGGGQNVQGAQASESQQINDAKTQANTQAISQAFQNELSSGIGLVGAGGAYVQSGIQQEIASNTALQGQLANLMGTLANAYARQTSGSGSGSGTASGSLGSILNNLLGKGSSGSVSPGSLTSGINADTASNIAGLTAYNNGFNVSGQDSALFGDINANMGADTLSNLNSVDTSLGGGATISLADLTGSASAASDAGGVASDIAGFSAGSAAAGTTLGNSAANLGNVGSPDFGSIVNNIPAANFGSDASSAAGGGASAFRTATGAVGSALGISGAIMNPTNAGADINGAVSAYNLGSTIAGGDTLGASLGASLGISAGLATAGIGAVALGVEALVTSMTKPNNPDRINVAGAQAEGMQVNPMGKLPSGNSVLFDNSLGVGAGTQSSKGSGEIYQLNAKGSAADNTAYHWIGQADSTNLENDAHNLNQWLQKGDVKDTNGKYTATDAAGQRTLGGISSIFNSTGGAKAWGMTESEFVTSLNKLLSSGAYSSGNAFGRGN